MGEPMTQIVDGRVHMVLVQGPYLGDAFIAGVYSNKEAAMQKVGELDRKYGRGHTTLVSERVQEDYVPPEPPRYDTYEVRALIDGWSCGWDSFLVERDAHITGYNIVQAVDKGIYRIYVRARSKDEAVVLGKSVFRDYILGVI